MEQQNNMEASQVEEHEHLTETIKTSVSPKTLGEIVTRIAELANLHGKDTIDMSKFLRSAIDAYFQVYPNADFNLFEDRHKTVCRLQDTLEEREESVRDSEAKLDESNKLRKLAEEKGVSNRNIFHSFVFDLLKLFDVATNHGLATFLKPDDTGGGKEVVINFYNDEGEFDCDSAKFGVVYDDIKLKHNSHKSAIDSYKTELSNLIKTIANALDYEVLPKESYGFLASEFGRCITQLKIEIDTLQEQNDALKNRGFFSKIFKGRK